MRISFTFLLIFSALSCVTSASLAQETPQIDMPTGKIVQPQTAGAATLRYFGFRAFDAVLVTPNGAAYDRNGQAALQLRYARFFSKAKLLDATMIEFARLEGEQTDHPEIRAKLTNCFADVSPQDRFLAVGIAPDLIELYRNKERTCAMRHKGIRARFLDIWLSPDSRFPSLSRKLRGQ